MARRTSMYSTDSPDRVLRFGMPSKPGVSARRFGLACLKMMCSQEAFSVRIIR